MTVQPAIPVIETARLRLRGPVMADMNAYTAFIVSDRAIPVGTRRERDWIAPSGRAGLLSRHPEAA